MLHLATLTEGQFTVVHLQSRRRFFWRLFMGPSHHCHSKLQVTAAIIASFEVGQISCKGAEQS
jgi:hypothetical protein